MATPRQVQNTLKQFTKYLDHANRDIAELLQAIRDLEKALTEYNQDEDLDVTRAIKREIKRGKKEIDELRKNVDKLDRELSDTNRKFSNLAR